MAWTTKPLGGGGGEKKKKKGMYKQAGGGGGEAKPSGPTTIFIFMYINGKLV